jgi:hypothetical protein
MFTIRTISKSNGKPVQSAGVRVCFDGLFSGMTSNCYTDSNGDANFNNDPGTGIVYVNGTEVYRGQISGRINVYI